MIAMRLFFWIGQAMLFLLALASGFVFILVAGGESSTLLSLWNCCGITREGAVYVSILPAVVGLSCCAASMLWWRRGR